MVRGEEYRTTLICIDEYQNGVPSGRFYNPNTQKGKTFRGIMEFISEMEKNLEAINFPKGYTTVRSFSEIPRETTGPPTEIPITGKQATFALKVLFRQNASWQGHITWLEGKKEQSFRSVLELLLLMNSALAA